MLDGAVGNAVFANYSQDPEAVGAHRLWDVLRVAKEVNTIGSA